MFSFHKPRVYRSVSGCCICRAKSSSSRFTDSKRYEDVFYECFKLREHRSGEICNACVLLVKRWKKLPVGSHKHWHHVVDARAGHGSKPISKINKVKKLNKVKTAATGKKVVKVIKSSTMLKQVEHVAEFQQVSVGMKKKLYTIPEITTTNNGSKRKRTASPSAFSDDVHFAVDCLSSESGSGHSSLDTSPVPSPVNFDEEDCISTAAAAGVLERKEKLAEKNNSGRRRVKSLIPQKNRATMSSFLDLTFWKREKTCCGIIFKGPFGEVLLDRRFLNPCYCRSSSNSSNPSSTLPSPTGGPKPTGLDCFALRNFDDEEEDEDEVEDEEEDEVDDEDELASNGSLETFLSGPATGGPVKDNSIGGSFVANFALKVD